ncbi:unnamed protein product [Sphagnum troendelagicum]|uniref:DUF4378 domain-containing protein n=1 Tax=Sphagnum troendelagicum TaxID=128251 RepID=A0ABP0UNQ7_9BRYO
MAEGARSTPSFHTMQSPQVGGGCASSFFQLFQRNSSKRRFSLTSKRLPADGSDKFSRRGRSLKPEEEDRHQPVPAAAAPAAQLLTDEEGKRKGFPVPVAAENAQKTTSSDSRAPSPMVVCNKKAPGVVARLMGLESLPLSGIAYPRTSKNIKSITSVDTDTSSRGAWDIVQQQEQPPLPERKDEKQLSIVSSHRSSSSPRQLCPALLPSKSHNQIITPSPLRSPSTHKGTARLLEAAAKILEPNMQPCIRPHRASSSSSSHGRKPPSPSPPPPPIVHSAIVGDPRGKNGISSRSGERVVVVASETAARKVRNTGYNSTASLSNNSSISKDLRGQAMSRTWNGRDEKEVNSARVDVSSRFNGGSVSFRESSCRYDHHVGSIRGRRVDCVVLGNQLPSLSPPVNQHCRRSKAISNTKTGDSPEVNRPSSAIPKNKDATASVQKSKAESRINSYGCSIKASSEKLPFAITASSSSSATTPDEGNARHHQERSSMSKFSFDNQEKIHQCNKIPDQQLLLETGDGRATEDALNQNTPVEFNGGCSAESPTDSNTDRYRGSTLDTAVISSVKFESKMSVGSIIPVHRRMRSIDEVLSELPVDSDVRACPLADTCTGDATSVSCPQKEPKMQLFTEGSDDLRIEDETEQWRRSLLLMGSISESQAYSNMVDSAHDLFFSGDSLETGTWSTPSVAGSSADCTAERHKHTLHSSTPSTTTGEEEASEGLTPILHKWFLESSNGSAMGIGEGEQPSPVSILDSPFQDEVSITPEPSLAESDRHLDEVLELHNMCGVLGIQPSSQLDEIDVVKARDTQQESSKHSGGSNLLTEEIADIRENEKIRQAILEISKFQTADLHDRLGKSQPARADEEQSFVHGILKAAQFLSHNNEEESSLKWFAPGLPLDPSLFDRLESGDTEQISIGAGGGGVGGNLNLAQMSTHCQYGALWRCDRKLLFDSINEALVTEIGYGGEPKQPWMVNDNILVGPNPTLRLPGGCSNKLVEDIYRTISKWRELASNAIDSLINMDMNKCCRLGKWRYYEHEIRDISLEIASMLLGMILDELVTDLAAAPAATSLLENWQAS